MAQDRTNPFSRETERHTDSPEQQGREGGGNVREGQKHFRCADVGFADCRWETSGRSADALMPDIERHGREQHNLSEADIERSRGKIRNAIKDRAA